MANPWPIIPSAGVTDRVYEAIRDRIIRGEVAPGESIRQDEISQAMGVSRTPVREALMRLVSDGYVERVHRRGFKVAGESIGDLIALYPILAALEVLACRASFPALDRQNLAELRQYNRAIERAVSRGDAKTAIQLNQRFHHALVARSSNHRLTRLLSDLSSEVTRLEIWSFSSETDRHQTVKDHEQILASLERRDYATAIAILERDRLSTYNEYVAQVGPPDDSSPPSQRTPQTRAPSSDLRTQPTKKRRAEAQPARPRRRSPGTIRDERGRR